MNRLAKRIMRIAEEVETAELVSNALEKKNAFLEAFSNLVDNFLVELDKHVSVLREQSGSNVFENGANQMKESAKTALNKVSELLSFDDINYENILEIGDKSHKATKIAASVIYGSRGEYSKIGSEIAYLSTKSLSLRKACGIAASNMQDFEDIIAKIWLRSDLDSSLYINI